MGQLLLQLSCQRFKKHFLQKLNFFKDFGGRWRWYEVVRDSDPTWKRLVWPFSVMFSKCVHKQTKNLASFESQFGRLFYSLDIVKCLHCDLIIDIVQQLTTHWSLLGRFVNPSLLSLYRSVLCEVDFDSLCDCRGHGSLLLLFDDDRGALDFWPRISRFWSFRLMLCFR